MYWKSIILVIILIFIVSVSISAADHNVVIEIEGMTCPLCPVAIKKSLLTVEGVKDVNISLEDKKAWLRVDERVSDALLLKAIERAGPYKGRIRREYR